MKAHYLIHHLKPLSLYTWGVFPEGFIQQVCLQYSPQIWLWPKCDWKAIKLPTTIPKDKCLKIRLNSFLWFLSESQFLIAAFVHFRRASCFFIPVAVNFCSTSFQQYTNIQVGQLNMLNFDERSVSHSVCRSITLMPECPCPIHHHSWLKILADISSKQAKTGEINHLYLFTLFPSLPAPRHLKFQY